tara:strand:+ start:372 stop:1352 length:981 start_codon:yes stop_codon:yes gene_type:complete
MMDLFGRTDKDIIQEYFLFWRKKGFPHYNKNVYNKRNEFIKLKNFNENTIYSNNTIKQTMHSCGFLWTYFPHWIDVKYKNNKTLLELWNDDNKLLSLIEKTFNYEKKYGNNTITTNRLRQNSKVYLLKQSVSNFRPSVAKFIYNKYGNNGIVWDMSCGWGGRLFGFLTSDCKKYIGTDPSTKTFLGLLSMKKDFEFVKKDIEIYDKGSEDFIPNENSLDLCFTSPPYFDTEKYSDCKKQSYKRFNKIDYWLNLFLNTTIKNCYIGLKKGGYLIMNISNTKEVNILEEKTKEFAEKAGFNFIKELKMELSSIAGNGVKYEPIFIFRK